MDATERDIWSSPDLASDPAASTLTSKQRPTSQGFFADALGDAGGWGLPTPSTSTTALSETSRQNEISAEVDTLEGLKLTENGQVGQDPGAPLSSAVPPLLPKADEGEEEEDHFADFDDASGDEKGHTSPQHSPTTAATKSAIAALADDDDFGDFGDFPVDGQEGVIDMGFGDEEDSFGDDEGFGAAVAGQVQSEESPLPSPAVQEYPRFSLALSSGSPSIASQVQDILSPPLSFGGPADPFGTGQAPNLSQERIRQAVGPAQVLAGESSRRIYTDLVSPPPLKPVDWLRSRTRRDLHISLGVPINLDEIMYIDSPSSSSPSGSGRRLPPLAIHLTNNGPTTAVPEGEGGSMRIPLRQDSTSSSSSSVGTGAGRNPIHGAQQQANGGNGSRSHSRGQGRKERIAEKRREDLGLGPMPEVDMRRVEQVCNLSEDQLSLLTLPSLRSLTAEITHLTSSTSQLLTHHLTLRESLQADSEMYNGLIKDLVMGAASRLGDSKGGGAGAKGGVSRQSSGRRFGHGSAGSNGGGNVLGSGRNSPRSASPFSLVSKSLFEDHRLLQ